MLVVGTKGRPLDGVQGLFSTRNSFSKYCLQYSPVPVVVVRPTEKRIKKKSKRANDPNRHSYAAMLAYNGGVHEADSDSGGVYELEARLSPDEEAHRVAAALGLPASFDPTIKKADIAALLSQRHHPPSPSMLSAQMAAATGITPTEVATAPKNESPAVGGPGAKDLSVGPESTVASSAGGEDSDGASGGDSSDDDDDSPEFETISGKSALEQDRKLDRLHDMERGEARALLKQARKGSVDSGAVDDEEDDD